MIYKTNNIILLGLCQTPGWGELCKPHCTDDRWHHTLCGKLLGCICGNQQAIQCSHQVHAPIWWWRPPRMVLWVLPSGVDEEVSPGWAEAAKCHKVTLHCCNGHPENHMFWYFGGFKNKDHELLIMYYSSWFGSGCRKKPRKTTWRQCPNHPCWSAVSGARSELQNEKHVLPL